MTCIVGIVYEGDVYIGGDRSAIDGWNRLVSEESKIFRIGEILMGTSGSHLVMQALKYELKLSRLQHMEGETDLQYLITVFAKEVRNLLAGLTTKRDEDGEASFSGGALIGYRGNLYRMSSNCQINSFVRRFDAIGSGAPFAMGAVAASGLGDPVKIIQQALRVTAELCCDVIGPFDVESLTWDPEAIQKAFLESVSKLPESARTRINGGTFVDSVRPAPPEPKPAAYPPSSITL